MSENVELRQLGKDGQKFRTVDSWPDKMMKKLNSPYLGIILATFSSFFFSLCAVIVKELVDINPIELASFRFLGVLLPALPIVIYTKQPVFPKGQRVALILRCFLGSTSLLLSFYAFRRMSLADASIIVFSTPVFVACFAKFILKEPCGLFHAVTIVLTLIGVFLITRPPLFFGYNDEPTFSSNGVTEQKYDIWGPICAISATLFGAQVYILLRALRNIHYSVIMTNFGTFSVLYTLIVSYMLGALCWPACGRDRFLVVILGIFSFLGQILLTLSLQVEQAGPVAIARCSDIVFAIIWQILFFGETPTGYSFVGALLVVSSVVLTGLKKYALTLPRESSARKRLRYFLFE